MLLFLCEGIQKSIYFAKNLIISKYMKKLILNLFVNGKSLQKVTVSSADLFGEFAPLRLKY